jgi:hypothetical protein
MIFGPIGHVDSSESIEFTWLVLVGFLLIIELHSSSAQRPPDFPATSAHQRTQLDHPAGNQDISLCLVALCKYPSGSVLPVVVVSAKPVANRSESGEAVVFDRVGYCWSHYPTAEGAKVVIVRSDGCIGACSMRGIEQYRDVTRILRIVLLVVALFVLQR